MKSHSSEIQSSEADLCAVISSLEPAGAEFAFAALIGEAVRAGRRVQVITIRSPGETDLSLPQEVRRTSLHLNLREVSGLKKIFLFCRLFWRLRREFTKSSSHTLLSFMTQTNVVALLCSFGCFQRRVVCERTHPEYAPFLGKPPLRGILRLVRNLVYSIADTVIVQSPSMVQCFPSRLHPKIKVIPNFLRDFALGFDVRVPREKTVLSVGRLVESKDHLIAIRVFARASARVPDWKMKIVGDGPERERLLQEIDELGLQDSVSILPFSHELERFYQESRVFLFCSRFEGFPNVVLEAMSFGLPVVAVRSPGAIADLVQPGATGELAELGDLEDLSDQLVRLMSDESLCRTMSANARQSIERFGRASVLQEWRKVLSW